MKDRPGSDNGIWGNLLPALSVINTPFLFRILLKPILLPDTEGSIVASKTPL